MYSNKLKALFVFLVISVWFYCPGAAAAETTGQLGGQDANGNYWWTVDTDGVLIGYSGAAISLGGVSKESWGSVISPWEDSGTTTTLTSAPTKFILTHSTGVSSFTGYIAGTADVVLENGQILDGGTDTKLIFTEAGDSLEIEFTTNDISIDASDGGIIFALTDATDGTVDFMTNNDSDDYIQISTTGNQSLINFVGQNGKITAASGTIDFDNENLTTSGTLGAGATTVTSLIVGDDTLTVTVDDQLRFASNDEESTIEAYGFEAKAAVLQLSADEGDDAGDKFQLVSTTSNTLTFTNDTGVKDTHAVILTLDKTGLLTTTGDIAVVNNTATTNAVVDVLSVEASSTGTAAAGLGVGVSFRVEDETTSAEEQASIDVVVTDASTGAENADFIINLNNIGTIREGFRIDTDVTATAATVFELTSWTIETNGVMNVLELTLDNTADTATDGYGMAISFMLEDETGVEERASIDVVQTDGARATNDTDFVFTQDLNGTLTETVRFDADGGTINILGATPIYFEGATADAYETILAVGDAASSDKTVTLPSITASIALETVATVVITADTTATITVAPGTDQLFTYTIDTDDEDCTLTFSAGGTAGDIATIIFITDAAGSADEVMTFHGTLSDSEGTLTLANGASKRYVIQFISDGTIWNEVSRTAVLG